MARTDRGLLPAERLIWRRFVQAENVRPDAIAFSFRVGRGAAVPPDAPDWYRRLVRAVTAKRVDVVMVWRGQLWVVEIKDRVSLTALGQLLGYGTLLLSAIAHPDEFAALPMVNPEEVEVIRRAREIVPWPRDLDRFATATDLVRARPGLLRLVGLAERVAPDALGVFEASGAEVFLV